MMIGTDADTGRRVMWWAGVWWYLDDGTIRTVTDVALDRLDAEPERGTA
jgi:hypothetical protein